MRIKIEVSSLRISDLILSKDSVAAVYKIESGAGFCADQKRYRNGFVVHAFIVTSSLTAGPCVTLSMWDGDTVWIERYSPLPA